MSLSAAPGEERPAAHPTDTAHPTHPASKVALVAAIVLLACNLRPALASVAPVLTEVQRSTGLSSAAAGILTTVPVVGFGACAPVAPVLGRRFGIEATLLGVLALLGAGILVRSTPSLVGLFAGTVAVGVAIAVGNVLLPALIKRDFPGRARQMTGIYSVALAGGAALAAGITVPIERVTGFGWQGTLALWAVPAAAAAVLWTRRLVDTHRDIDAVHVSGRLWRDPLAWQVTAFMGLQSLGFYSTLAWLPTIFEQHGVAPTPAGWLLSLAGIASLPSAFAAPVVAATPGRQKAALAIVVILNALALGGLVWQPVAGSIAWMALLGLAQGAALSLALSFIVLRAPSPARAAELSGMAQTVGYLMAGLGPFVVGAVHEATGGWSGPLLLLLVLLVPELVMGLRAARPRVVGDPGTAPDGRWRPTPGEAASGDAAV